MIRWPIMLDSNEIHAAQTTTKVRKNLKRRSFLAGTALAISGGALGYGLLSSSSDTGLKTISGKTMGTYYRVVVPEADAPDENMVSSIGDVVAHLDNLMSTYKPASEVSRFNAAIPEQRCVFSDHTIEVVNRAREVSDLTHGAFDITIEPLVNLWGFGANGKTPTLPTQASIAATAQKTGMDALHFDETACWKTRTELAIDLNGIGKGYAVDQLAELLEAKNITDFLVDIGGELRASGRKPNGDVWLVGIENPASTQHGIRSVVALDGKAIATSGDYRQFFIHDGREYSHVIDPRTAEPVAHRLASVTVVADAAAMADAISTALMVMGPEDGFDFARKRGIAAFFVERQGDELVNRYTPELGPFLPLET